MPTFINSNLMAATTARNLNSHYASLATSTQRLSSGLRINSSADDAAGLAIRELMRSDIVATAQGVRNANDAISLIQVADGALGIIDEKLIRMKELAEQAATGTYDSTQRLMIHSEFQEMAAEIDRIANATDFNGIKLLDGSRTGEHDGSTLESSGRLKIHFGSGNDSAEDYYYLDIGDCSTKGLGLHDPVVGTGPATVITGADWILDDAVIDWDNNTLVLDVRYRIAGPDNTALPGGQPTDKHPASPQAVSSMPGFDYYALPAGLLNVTATSRGSGEKATHKPHINLFTKDGTQITGVSPAKDWTPWPYNAQTKPTGLIWWNVSGDHTGDIDAVTSQLMSQLADSGVIDQDAVYNGDNVLFQTGETATVAGMNFEILSGMDAQAPNEETIFIDEITSDLVFLIGGHDTPSSANMCNVYDLKIEAEISPELKARLLGGETVIGDETQMLDIKTQEKAQKALVRIDSAIIAKDKVRAHLGAMQNRLENTVSNLSIQGENLQAAESRISDTDVAIEMTKFVRNQVLTQSAVAMLGQANSYPHILIQLFGGR